MPHIIVECSENLSPFLKKQEFLRVLGAAAIETEVFPIGGMRIRLYCASDYLIADGDLKNSFVHIHLRIGAGRDEDTKRYVANHIFDAAERHLNDFFDNHPLGLSLELSEIAQPTSFKRNNLHAHVESRMANAKGTK